LNETEASGSGRPLSPNANRKWFNVKFMQMQCVCNTVQEI
jgi:hypothetical protein